MRKREAAEMFGFRTELGWVRASSLQQKPEGGPAMQHVEEVLLASHS